MALECEDRNQLEGLLGAPRYAMQGTSYGTANSDHEPLSRPDVVEVYEHDGCMIEVWFKDDAMMSMYAFAFPTSWEVVAGALDANST